jgi:cytochrome o ubiquinol oxidase operon protein cyoD
MIESKQLAQKREERLEFWIYTSGFSLALILTLLPFAMVYWAVIPHFPLLVEIGVYALVQMFVHFHFFLQIGFRQKREDLHLILFSALLLVIMVGGTLWIMASLATRMSMPLHL